MKLSLQALLCGEADRLRYIRRFSTCYVVHEESVAEHSFYVALYSFMIAEWAVAQGTPLNLASVLSRAIVHDLEEARTGDIFRPLKVNHPDVKKALAEAAQFEVGEVLRGPFGNDPEAMVRWTALWSVAKEPDTPEGAVVAFADFLSVLGYVLSEIKVSNVTMRVHRDTLLPYAESFLTEPAYEFLRPLARDAHDLLWEALRETA